MPFQFENSPGYLLNRCAIFLRIELEFRFSQQGIAVSAEEWAILAILWSRGNLSVNEVASLTLKDRTTVTRFLDRFEKQNLVKRQQSSEDKRSKEISLTVSGSRLVKKLMQVAETMLNEFFSDVDSRDVDHLKRTLTKLLGIMNKKTMRLHI